MSDWRNMIDWRGMTLCYSVRNKAFLRCFMGLGGMAGGWVGRG